MLMDKSRATPTSRYDPGILRTSVPLSQYFSMSTYQNWSAANNFTFTGFHTSNMCLGKRQSPFFTAHLQTLSTKPSDTNLLAAHPMPMGLLSSPQEDLKITQLAGETCGTKESYQGGAIAFSQRFSSTLIQISTQRFSGEPDWAVDTWPTQVGWSR